MLFFKGNKEVLDLIGNAATIGTHLVAATFVGLGIGWYLDKWLGTKPWLLLIFLCLGIAAGFKNVYDEVQRIQKKDRGKGPGNNENKSEG
ncbi:AtpZ/AtpI family protein [Maridesulfovibrio sp.]|uniref:AtpZ/AtpI family protein n=1 Tax=Maridesulfovibrio sp. TaxID=2795000 RepID=UPI002A18DA08|nr:AtpZ/AtpI family protein [Maridesulfovibrio sp.]